MRKCAWKGAWLCRRRAGLPVCTENIKPHILVMKAAENNVRRDIPNTLSGTKARRIFGQRPMRPDFIVIVGVAAPDPMQVCLA